MVSDPIQQAVNQLKAVNNILIIPGSSSDLDIMASAFALHEFLGALGKKASVYAATLLAERLKFLPEANILKSAGELTKNLVVDINLEKSDLSELTYEKADNRLSIFLTPKSGELSAQDVSVRGAVYPFDLIVTLGLVSLEDLGVLYERHTQLFFELPVINIDFRPGNEHYGQINLVNLAGAAVSEAVFELLKALDKTFINEKIATLLLSGLIEQTNSFQSLKTTPRAFAVAAELVNFGAKQQDILTELYRSKSLGLLKLWGRVLARLKHDQERSLVSSMVSQADIEKSEATESDSGEIIFEMMQQLSFAKNFLFLVELGPNTEVYAANSGAISLLNLFSSFSPASLGPQILKFQIPKPLTQAEEELIQMFPRV